MSSWINKSPLFTSSPSSTKISFAIPPMGICISLTSPIGTSFPETSTISSVFAKDNQETPNNAVPIIPQVTDLNQNDLVGEDFHILPYI